MQKAISQLRKSLSLHYDHRETNAIIDLLLEEVCGTTKVDRIMNPERALSDEQHSRLLEIGQQLSKGMPVQYALGYEYFKGKRFLVNEGVLIPRPETAELVDWIVEDTEGRTVDAINPTRISILDIGTGSGCIALSLATLINNSFIIAADLSTVALKTAKENAEELKINNIMFVEMDILKEMNHSFQQPSVDKFDIIVSNPPYIMESEKKEMNCNVLDYEPHLALFVPDDDPLLFYRAIAKFGKKNLKDGGNLYFEINAAFGKETCELLSRDGYENIILLKDINGRDRMIKATYYEGTN